MMKITILTLAGLMSLASFSQAGVNGREQRQNARIRGGVKSGELTRRETARLAAEQAAIRAEEYRYRHDDGRLGPWERFDLQRDLSRASRDIHGQKNDGQERY